LFGNLERVVCSSIGRPDRGFESLKVARHRASVASGEFLVWFGDLERVVCSSIGHLRPRIRGPEGDSAPASVSEFGKRFDGYSGMRVCVQVSRFAL